MMWQIYRRLQPHLLNYVRGMAFLEYDFLGGRVLVLARLPLLRP